MKKDLTLINTPWKNLSISLKLFKELQMEQQINNIIMSNILMNLKIQFKEQTKNNPKIFYLHQSK